jgi:hypothetical protein
MRSLAVIALLALVFPAGSRGSDVVRESDGARGFSRALAPDLPATAVAPTAVRIETRDFSIAMPAHIPSGLVDFTLDNHGAEPHEIRFIRLADRHTFDDFVAWQKSGTAIPDWLTSAGGIGAVAPGLHQEYLMSLQPGAYVALCSYPSADGTSHTAKGMFAAVTVDAPAGGAVATPPEADETITMSDHHFQLTVPMDGPHPMVHLRNTGSEPHQALIIRLPDERQQFPELAWFDHGGKGPRPGVPVGGSVEVPADGEAWFRADLTPGRYMLLCTQAEEDGRHYELGMMYNFTIE